MNANSGRQGTNGRMGAFGTLLLGASMLLPAAGFAADMAALCKGGAGWNQVLQEAQ